MFGYWFRRRRSAREVERHWALVKTLAESEAARFAGDDAEMRSVLTVYGIHYGEKMLRMLGVNV